MAHTASKGLRELADLLDSMADEGFDVNASVHIEGITQSNQKAIFKRLGLSVKKPLKDSDLFIYPEGEINGVKLSAMLYARDFCERKTVMRLVEVWTCGGQELSA